MIVRSSEKMAPLVIIEKLDVISINLFSGSKLIDNYGYQFDILNKTLFKI